MALGKNLQRIRESKKLSQDALSKLTGWTEETPDIGVSQGAISALEKRDSTSSKHAPKLAKALAVSLDELLGLKSSLKVESPVAEYRTRDPILDDLAALDPEDADVWRAQIKAAAIKARKAKQEKSDRQPAVRDDDPPSEGRRTA